MMIQESKLEKVCQNTVKDLWELVDCDLSFVPCEGISGSLIILWNIKIMYIRESDHFMEHSYNSHRG